MPRFEGVIGLIGFLILAYLLVNKSSGAETVFTSLANSGKTLIGTLQGR